MKRNPPREIKGGYRPAEEGEMANWSMEEALRMALRLEAENFAEYEKSAAEEIGRAHV